MKLRIIFWLVSFICIIGFYACTPVSLKTTSIPATLPPTTPIERLVHTSTVTKTITPISPTVALTPAPSKTPVTSPTSEKKELTASQGFKHQCISVGERPEDITLDGVLTFHSEKYGYYLLDMTDFTQHVFPLSKGAIGVYDYEVSPDRKWLAYLETYVDEHGYLNQLQLRLINAYGYRKMLSYWTINWQGINGWTNNDELMLSLPGRSNGAITILNPFTGQWYEFSLTIPDNALPIWDYPSVFSPLILYNSTLTYAVYGNVYLWDIQGQKSLWQGNRHFWQDSWSPDGKQLTLELNGHLYVLNINGQETELLYLPALDIPTNTYNSTEIGHMSWSPDGSLIAVWLGNPSHLAIIDIETKFITDLCIKNKNLNPSSPIWSPDGKYIAVEVGHEEYWDFSSDTMIIAVEAGYAFKIVDDAEPLGWLSKP